MARMSKKRFRKFTGKRSYEIDHAAFSVGLHIFADGACEPNPGPGGWGVAVYRDGVEVASDHGGDADTTNNRMELTGLLRGIEAAKALGAPAILWCDSQYAVKGANEWMHNWKKRGWKKPGNEELKNIELWQSIDAALSGPDQITIRWCKGHAGIIGNERADELSNIGIASVLGVPIVQEPVEYLTAEYRALLRNNAEISKI
ncbi:ribonuclease H family protein [Sinorhizobium medicae]|uniref:ribonuclease H family protein n=1 Tax=Sinorhizobium medicae TaxID=110321 RepID=UPI00042953D6|nr:ribonuclease H [Sinorhizobium medicae]RVQ68145.1 ribonuclease HI [Sinorhizobium medicae]